MAQRKTLTDSQVGVLRWIGQGCPDGVMKDDFHRISAAALKRRGLVDVVGRRSDWSASITDGGRAYLEKVDGPEPPIARQANASVTQQLVDEVIDAGGTLRVPTSWGTGRVDYWNRAQLAERHRKVPPGKRLDVSRISNEEVEIRLLDAPGLGEAELVDVDVPDRVSRYHPAVRHFRDAKASHAVSREALPRTSRILHAVASEAVRRGWSAPTQSREAGGAEGGGSLEIVAVDQIFWIHISEGGVGNRGSWESELEHHRSMQRDFRYYSGSAPSRAYDADADGKLTLELGTKKPWRFRGRQSRWSDRSSWTLEERLPHLFVEIEERAAEANRIDEEERIAADEAAARETREREEREEQWNGLMAQAKERLIEAHRASQLRKELDSWELTDRIGRYCDALEAAQKGDQDAKAWIAWARDYAKKIDPLLRPTSIPEDPEVTHEALQKHLPIGWSTYGPEHGWQPQRDFRAVVG